MPRFSRPAGYPCCYVSPGWSWLCCWKNQNHTPGSISGRISNWWDHKQRKQILAKCRSCWKSERAFLYRHPKRSDFFFQFHEIVNFVFSQSVAQVHFHFKQKSSIVGDFVFFENLFSSSNVHDCVSKVNFSGGVWKNDSETLWIFLFFPW